MSKANQRIRRKKRIRKNIFGTSEKPRLTVFKSARHILAQIVNDVDGTTLATASSYGKAGAKDGKNIKGAKVVGEMVAAIAKAKKIESVVFDRNGYKYHGRIKALADAAREKGLKF